MSVDHLVLEYRRAEHPELEPRGEWFTSLSCEGGYAFMTSYLGNYKVTWLNGDNFYLKWFQNDHICWF